MSDTLLTIPNLLTFTRLVLSPMVFASAKDGYYGLALALFMIASATDWFDGAIARKLNQQSVLGSYLDPLADKVLILFSFLVIHKDLLVRMFYLIIVREVSILLGIGVLKICRAPLEISPVFSGKLSIALFFMLTFCWLLFAATGWPPTAIYSKIFNSLQLVLAFAIITSLSKYKNIFHDCWAKRQK